MEKILQDKIIDKSENESFCNIFTRYLDGKKNEPFSWIWTWKEI